VAATQTTRTTEAAQADLLGDAGSSDERAAAEAFAAQLLAVAQRVDPGATSTLAPPIDAGIWVVHLYVRDDLADEAHLRDVMAERTTDILVEHGVGLATVFHDR
jgi:hypothetical protein